MSRYTVRRTVAGRPAGHTPTAVLADDHTGGWRPTTWLGAPAPGGLALPQAVPSMSWMYSPRGAFVDDSHLVVADSGNHRVLVWHGVPSVDEQPADVVLGQADGYTEGRAAAGRGPERGMNLPTGVAIVDGRLIVADAWHHRILIWNSVPQRDDVAPDVVLGQSDAVSVEPNAGGECSAATFYWPFGFAVLGGRFWVADTGNRRVLGFDGGIPDPGQPADIVLGQPSPHSREENRGEAPGPASFRWPHAITGTDEVMLVADAGDHRVLGWSPHPASDRAANSVFGQQDFRSAEEWPYGPHSGDRFRFPYAVDLDGDTLAVADTANNRVLLWDGIPAEPLGGRPADHVLAQPGFTSNGENRWALVGHDTLCWPYGLSLHGGVMAIADSGNNRVMVWRRS